MINSHLNSSIDDLSRLKRVDDMKLDRGSHHYIVLSYLYEWMRTFAGKYAEGVLLDYGCGGQPYRGLLVPKVTRYISADVAQSPGVDLDIKLIANEPLPIRSATIDTVLSNQVLEHVSDPNHYLSEVSRILKSGGFLILTAPMHWRHHEEPFDYYRFTKYGIRELIERNNMKIVRMDSSGGVFALIGQVLASYLVENKITYRPFIYRMLNSFFLWLDRKCPDNKDTLLWMCIATKQ
jgi:SAM-dependent methyltransferase